MARKTDIVASSSEPSIVITRAFDAPRHLVFDAWTKPEHVKRWWGCEQNALVVCEIDLRVGGSFRYVMREPGGSEHGFHGVYREITRPERLVHTYVYEPFPDAEALVTMTLAEVGGRTTMVETTLHKTLAHRDGHLQSGMDAGADAALERLERVVASLM